jgi:hypothetical protein
MQTPSFEPNGFGECKAHFEMGRHQKAPPVTFLRPPPLRRLHGSVAHAGVVILAMAPQGAGAITDRTIVEGDGRCAIPGNVGGIEVDQMRILHDAMRVMAGGAGRPFLNDVFPVVTPTA